MGDRRGIRDAKTGNELDRGMNAKARQRGDGEGGERWRGCREGAGVYVRQTSDDA